MKIAALRSRWKRNLLRSGNYQSLSYSLSFINLISHRQCPYFTPFVVIFVQGYDEEDGETDEAWKRMNGALCAHMTMVGLFP